MKMGIFKGSKKLLELAIDHCMKNVFIKGDDPPLTRMIDCTVKETICVRQKTPKIRQIPTTLFVLNVARIKCRERRERPLRKMSRVLNVAKD